MWALLFALLATAVVVTGVAGLRSLKSDPLAALSAEDREIIRSDAQLRRKRKGPFEQLGTRLGPHLTQLMGGSYRTWVERKIGQSDRKSFPEFAYFMAFKGSLLLVCGLGGVAISLITKSPLFVVLFLLLGFLLPDFVLHVNAQQRQTQIEDDLPDFLDILSITVSAGLSFRSALDRVTDRSTGPLAEEMTVVLRQMEVGESRFEAFSALKKRTDSESLNSFITALLQSEELGAPLADALDQIARDMRQTTAQNARQKAAKASPKIAGVVTMVMVPGTLVLILVSMYFMSGLDQRGLMG